MKRLALICWFVVIAWMPCVSSGWDADDERSINDWHAPGPPPVEPVREPQYAPDREVCISHLKLDVTPDFSARTVTGTAVLTCRIAGRPAREISFDAIDLRVRTVTASEKLQNYQATPEKLVVTFENPLPPGTEVKITVDYSASPRRGLYFRTPEMGYVPGDTHLFTQGEEIEARHWYPCLDAPNQMFTSEIICHVPQGMVAISNGKLVAEEQGTAGNGVNLATFHWLQEQPHANYLITLTAGFFKKLEDSYRGIPLAFYTPASQIDHAKSSFENTKDMMEFFEREIGVPYPWPKYYQICVNDFVAGGMENTSATTLTDTTLFSPASENIQSSDGLVAHELAHQWFGDLVTCKDWGHIWLNEGFATYYEALYERHKHGRDVFLYNMYEIARQITSVPNDTQAIVRRNFVRPGEMFGYLSYSKAGWVLHMLRAELGEDLYRECVRLLLERYRHQNVVTEDFRKIIEERSHRTFDRFFDQWLYHGQHPRLDVNYSWNELNKVATVSVRQTQTVSDQVRVFGFPLNIRFKGSFGVTNAVVQVTGKDHEFSIPLASAPSVMRIDPELTLLCELNLNLPSEMVQAQLEDQTDVLGRLQAVERLTKRRDHDAITQLARLLQNDPFYGVRLEASQALRSIHNDEALQALLKSTSQPDARVRRQVLEDIGGFFDSDALAAIRKALDTETNPSIVATGVRGLAAYPGPEIPPLLLQYLYTPSFENEIAQAAIQAMTRHRHRPFIEPVMQYLSTNRVAFGRQGYSRSLSSLAQLSKDLDDKSAVYDFLLSQLESEKGVVRLSAIAALGTLGDARAMGVLEKYTTASKELPEYRSAERALNQLRAAPAKPAADESSSLRQEVLDLKKEQRELKSQLEEARKSLKEREPASESGDAAGTSQKSDGKKAVNAPQRKPVLESPKTARP